MIPCRIDQQYLEEEQAQERKYVQYNIGKRRSSFMDSVSSVRFLFSHVIFLPSSDDVSSSHLPDSV